MDNSALPANSKDLYDLLESFGLGGVEETDKANLRYAVYARRSTTAEGRQERSIEDQVHDCIEKVVKPEGLTVVEVVEEKCSAKHPDIRSEFRRLVNDVRSGKIDGIISWHPDRLSRNMKEAGEIIDLLDKGTLKDLKFATFTFENNPTGKMLLGISFVLSKQYSEHLSESVVRGNRRKTENGYFFSNMKHGYTILDGRLYPDGESFGIVVNAFQRRLEGQSQVQITEWLNSTNYKITKKDKEPKSYKWDKDAVSKMLKDPVYAGVLRYGDHHAILENYYDFTPAISVDDFFKINKVSSFSSKKLTSSLMANKREDTKANLLRGMVHCGYCKKPFSSGLTPKNLKSGKAYYYFYKCENRECEFYNKSVRAGLVLAFAYDFLDMHLFTTKSNYQSFLKEAKQNAAQLNQKLSSNIGSTTKQIGIKEVDYDNTKQLIKENPALSKHYDLDHMSDEINTLKENLNKLVKQRSDSKDALITYRQYLELFKDISVKLDKTHDMELIDQVLKKFFSNFTVWSSGRGKQQRCEIEYKLKEPWAGFLNSNDFDLGRG